MDYAVGLAFRVPAALHAGMTMLTVAISASLTAELVSDDRFINEYEQARQNHL